MLNIIKPNKEAVANIFKLILSPETEIPISVPSKELNNFRDEDITAACHFKGIYGIVTDELVEFLSYIIGDYSAIEVAAGYGTLGRSLGIPRTDFKAQDRLEVKLHYALGGQPTIDYPGDVIEYDALDAIKKYKPKVVLASWFTAKKDIDGNDMNMYGIDEDDILNNNSIEIYIHIGHESVHKNKAILRHSHDVISAPWLRSRSMSKGVPQIRIWSKKRIDYSKIPMSFSLEHL